MKRRVKQLYLIRHAKSSWSYPDLTDFDRPLSKRGEKNAPLMAERFSVRGIIPQRIVSSPARRAKMTARYMAKGTGFKKRNIIYEKGLYSAGYQEIISIIERHMSEVEILFVVGHNSIITDLAEDLTGEHFFNVPTCGVVGIEYSLKNKSVDILESGSLLFFDYPRNDGVVKTLHLLRH
jgi:phosphohistidine phosphatase